MTADPYATVARLLGISPDDAAAMTRDELIAARQRLADDVEIAKVELDFYLDDTGLDR